MVPPWAAPQLRPSIFNPGSCRNLGAGAPEFRLPGYKCARLTWPENGAGRQNPAPGTLRDGSALAGANLPATMAQHDLF